MPRLRWPLALLPAAIGLLALAAAGDTNLSPPAKPAPVREPALAVLSMLDSEPELAIEVSASKAVALQLDLVYNPRLLELRGGTASPATEAAGKQFTVRHLTAGRARVVVFGSNLTPLPAGELGTVTFRRLRRKDSTEVLAVRRHAADAAGHAMPTRVQAGGLLIMGHGKEASDENP